MRSIASKRTLLVAAITTATMAALGCSAAGDGTSSSTAGAIGTSDNVSSSTATATESWKQIRKGTGSRLTDVTSDAVGNVYAIGDEGLVYSADAGKSFKTYKSSEGDAQMVGIWQVGNDIFSVSDGLHSSPTTFFQWSAGADLSVTAPRTTKLSLAPIVGVAANGGNVFASGLSGVMLSSANGGQAWTNLKAIDGESYDAVWVADNGAVYFAGEDRLAFSEDQGANWFTIDMPIGTPRGVCGFQNNPFFVANGSAIFRRKTAAEFTVPAVKDSNLSSLTSSVTPMKSAPVARDLVSCFAPAARELYVFASGDRVLHSQDGGDSWSVQVVGDGEGNGSIRGNGDNVFLVTESGNIFQKCAIGSSDCPAPQLIAPGTCRETADCARGQVCTEDDHRCHALVR